MLQKYLRHHSFFIGKLITNRFKISSFLKVTQGKTFYE